VSLCRIDDLEVGIVKGGNEYTGALTVTAGDRHDSSVMVGGRWTQDFIDEGITSTNEEL
jgi:hypothetical protein